MDKLSPDTTFDLEYFFQVTPDLLCITGFDGYFRKVNPAVSKVLGYTDQELLEKPVNELIHPDDKAIAQRKRAGLAQGKSLLNFEVRYLTKDGNTVWLCWTSVPIFRDSLVFEIAKDITYRKQLEEYDRISSILGMINEDHQKKFRIDRAPMLNSHVSISSKTNGEEPSQYDQLWLHSFEQIVRQNAGSRELNLKLLSDELALSQRQLFRRVDRILGITPNKLVRIIRLQLAWEAIASGKYSTIKEISNIAGYGSRNHFSRLFKEVYGIHVTELL